MIGIALGCFWRQVQNQNRAQALRFVEHLPIQGVELTIGLRTDFESFQLNQHQNEYLTSLDYVSIHAPWSILHDYPEPEKMKEALEKIQSLVETTNAQSVVFHPPGIPPFKQIKKHKIPIVIENMQKKNSFPPEKLEQFLETYHAGFCLDTAHAYSIGKNETKHLLERFGPRLRQIHFSARYRQKDHEPLQKASTGFLKSLEPLRGKKTNIILEQDYHRIDYAFIRKEIQFARAFFQD